MWVFGDDRCGWVDTLSLCPRLRFDLGIWERAAAAVHGTLLVELAMSVFVNGWACMCVCL